MSNQPHGAREAQAEATREQIIRSAIKLFAEKGYSGAGLAEIVEASGVTTGAVYHHFGGKAGLFLVVAELIEQKILASVTQAAITKSGAWNQLLAAVDAMVGICAKSDVQRIVFIDAPTVIGPAAWREIEAKYALGALRHVLQSLVDEGALRFQSVDLMASILLGALTEAARAVADAPDKSAASEEARDILAAVFTAIRAPGQA